jgi:hypothetical protein
MMANYNFPAPITLPKLDLPDIDEIEAKEVAAVVRRGSGFSLVTFSAA